AVDTECVRASEPSEDDLPTRRPLAVPKELPINAPNLEIDAQAPDCVEQTFSPRLPAAQESDAATPARTVRMKRAVHFVAESERHVHQRPTDGLVMVVLVGLAIHQHIERTQSLIHQSCALPIDGEIWIRVEMHDFCPLFADLFDGLYPQELLFLCPNNIRLKVACRVNNGFINSVYD